MPAPPEYLKDFKAVLHIRFGHSDDAIADVQTERDLTPEIEPKKLEKPVSDKEKEIGQSPSSDTAVMVVTPLAVTISRNDFFEADTLDLTIDFDDCPLDPRIVRAVRVELYAGRIDKADFATGMETGKNRKGVSFDPQNLRFIGYAETMSASLYSGRTDTVSFDCRDYQAIFEDTRLDARHLISLGGDMMAGEFAGLLLNAFPAFKDIGVVDFNGAADRKVTKQTGRKKSGNENAWDYLERRLLDAGVIPYVWHDSGEPTLFLLKTEDAYKKTREFGWAAWHYSWEQNVRELEDYSAPVFVAGHNCNGLSMKRNFGRRSAPPIEVRTVQPSTQKVLSGVYPSEEWRKQHPERALVNASDSAPRIIEIPYPATVESSELAVEVELERKAKELFHLHAKQELQISFSTNDLSSYGMDVNSLDIFDLVPGDPIVLLEKSAVNLEENPKAGVNDTKARLTAMSERELVNHLKKSKGFPESVAAVVAKSLKRGLPHEFKLRRLTIHYDNGIVSVDIEAAEYIVAAMNPEGLEAFEGAFGAGTISEMA